MSFGSELRALRKKNNLTIEQLSKKSGVSVSYITMLENDAYGKKAPTEGTAKKLEEALGAKNNDLASFTVTKSTTAMIRAIYANPSLKGKFHDLLREIHKDGNVIDEIMKTIKK